MSARHKSPPVKESREPQRLATLNLQQNFHPKEVLPDASRLERMRSGAPEIYAAFLRQFELDAEHNRTMQQRAIGIDERAVPAMTGNERLGIVVAGLVSLGIIGAGIYGMYLGQSLGWIASTVGGLPWLVAAFRNRPSNDD